MTSMIEAGRSSDPLKQSDDLIGAVDKIFALFRINYHNQYYKAFPDTTTLNFTKKLWLESMKGVPYNAVVAAADQLVRSQDYLPTLSQMLRLAHAAAGEALPDPHTAFLEACRAPSPKASHAWSHPIVYHAGRRTGWHLLASQPERLTYPLFRKQFELLEQSHLSGKPLPPPEPDETAARVDHPAVDAEQGRARLKALRAKLKI